MALKLEVYIQCQTQLHKIHVWSKCDDSTPWEAVVRVDPINYENAWLEDHDLICIFQYSVLGCHDTHLL